MDYYATIRKDETMTFTAEKMELKGIRLGELSQRVSEVINLWHTEKVYIVLNNDKAMTMQYKTN